MDQIQYLRYLFWLPLPLLLRRRLLRLLLQDGFADDNSRKNATDNRKLLKEEVVVE